MKYLLAILIFSLSCNYTFGQIERTDLARWTIYSEVRSLGDLVASLKYMVKEKDTTYIILFRNLQYTHINDVQSISFNSDSAVLNSLYQILSETLDSKNRKQNTFKLGNKDVIATCIKVPGMKSVNIKLAETGAYFGLTRKELDKLFNKHK